MAYVPILYRKVFISFNYFNRMIYLTGDLHTKISNNWEQKKDGSELNAGREYLKILKRYNISSTLFINGVCLKKKKEEVKELLKFDIELGGHTYNNFGDMCLIKSYIYRRIWGCIYGHLRYQKKDIKKTKNAFEKFGLKMNSWRTHAFGSNEITFKTLKQEGVVYVSDLLGEQQPFEKGGIVHMPINIPVDQNTIAFGELRPENRCPFASCTKGRILPEEWFEILKKRVRANEKKRIPSILLIHPLTMKVLDDFKLFRRICRFLSKYKSNKISEFNLK